MKPKDDEKAKDILVATLKEVESVGLSGLSMEAVAKRAKVATGTVYIYFKNKTALVEALYLQTKHEFASNVLRANGDLPVRAAFQRMCVAFLDYLTKHKAEMVFITQVVNSPYLREKTRTEAALATAPLLELLERGKRELLLKELDSHLMVTFLHGALRELAPLLAAEPKVSRDERASEIASLCWDALKA